VARPPGVPPVKRPSDDPSPASKRACLPSPKSEAGPQAVGPYDPWTDLTSGPEDLWSDLTSTPLPRRPPIGKNAGETRAHGSVHPKHAEPASTEHSDPWKSSSPSPGPRLPPEPRPQRNRAPTNPDGDRETAICEAAARAFDPARVCQPSGATLKQELESSCLLLKNGLNLFTCPASSFTDPTGVRTSKHAGSL
jgi:hypothetical protein